MRSLLSFSSHPCVMVVLLLWGLAGCARSPSVVSSPAAPAGWASANLNVAHYHNGDPIAHVPDSAAWTSLTTGAWVYFENDSANGAHHGRLYNHYALTDPRGICPEGWHVATDDDWEVLVTAHGGADSAGYHLKAAQGWDSPNVVAATPSGFNALPSGNRKVDGIFNGKSLSAPFWTATVVDDSLAVARFMFHAHPRVGRRVGDRRHALACRCVQDGHIGNVSKQ